jgi:hypothetical protein
MCNTYPSIRCALAANEIYYNVKIYNNNFFTLYLLVTMVNRQL